MWTQYGGSIIGAQMRGEDVRLFPAGIWLGLHTAAPGWLGSTAAEVTIDTFGLSRFELTDWLSALDPDTGQVLTQILVEIGPPIADCGLLTHLSFHDAPVGGNMPLCEELEEAELLLAGGTFVRPPGGIGVDFRMGAA